MRELLDRIQVNMPFQLIVDRYLPLILKEGINPEIGIDCFALDHSDKDDFLRVANALHDHGLTITMHAPFYDLRPGAIDRKIREASIERLKQCFELVPHFKPQSLVCHAAFDERYYASNEELWLEHSKETWRHFLGLAAEMNTKIALENVYENDPFYLGRLLEYFKDDPRICFCMDTGHCNAFSNRSMEVWMERIGGHIGQLHLHDNHGFEDEHAPVGEGNFPFSDLFKRLKEGGHRPIITLEPHTEKDLWTSLVNIKSMKLLE